MTVTHIKPAQTETFSFEWGTMKGRRLAAVRPSVSWPSLKRTVRTGPRAGRSPGSPRR
jgi:hypothetical protein